MSSLPFFKDHFGDNVCIKARGVIGATLLNVSALSQNIKWASIFATAAKLDVSSSSAADDTGGTGAIKIVIYGLDEFYNPLTEEVTLDGQTPVTTDNSFLRVFAAYVLTSGTGGENAGDIYIIKTGTGGVYVAGVPPTLTSGCIKMTAGANLGYSGVWTAPAGSIYQVAEFIPSIRTQNGTIQIMKGSPEETEGKGPFAILKYEATAGASLNSVHPCLIISEKEDLYTQAVCAGAGGIVNVTLKLTKVQ